MTGVFPETGGGAGLSYGKESMKKLLTQFGARVTGSVSGKTDLLLVGKEPGMGKVSEARRRGLPMIETYAPARWRVQEEILLGTKIHWERGIVLSPWSPAPVQGLAVAATLASARCL